ncbi:MAG: hypothetical protein RR518_03530 [Coprobacillus sp.]
MKKLLMLILCGGLLVGCSSASGYDVKLSDADDVLVSGSGINVTKQGYFESLLKKYGSENILSKTLEAIADKEVNNQEELDKLVKEREKTYSDYADGDLEKYAKYLGYNSKEDYINEALIPDAKQELLRNKYIEDNFDKLLTDYQVCSFKKILVDKESTALTLIKEVKSEEDFDKKMKEYGTNAEDAGTVTKNSTLDDNLKTALKDLIAVKADGVYSTAIKLSDEKYAVLYMYNTDHKDKDALEKALSSDSSLKTETEVYYLKKYNFTVNDSKLKNEIQELNKDYIG